MLSRTNSENAPKDLVFVEIAFVWNVGTKIFIFKR